MAGKARRTVLRSSTGKKLYAVRDKNGKFEDIQSYARAHRADLAASAKSETSAKSTAAVAKKASDDKKDDAALKKAADDTAKVATDAEVVSKKAEMDVKNALNGMTQSDKAVKEATDAVATAKALIVSTTAQQVASDTALKAGTAESLTKEKPFRAVAFSRDGKELAVAGDLGTINTYDSTTGSPLEVIDAHTGPVLALAYAGDHTLVTGSADQTAKAWSLNPPYKLAGVLGPKKETPGDLNTSVFVDRVLCLDFSHNGQLLATGGGDPSRSGELMIWDVKTQAVVKSLPDAHSDTVFGVQFSRDDKLLLTGAADKFVKIFDVATGEKVKSFEGHTNHVLGVAWKYDGKLIASAGADNAVKIWNVETGEQARTIAGYTKQVTSLQFMGRGQNVVSCAGDKTVRFHQADNGGNIRTFAGANDFLFAVTGSADEKIVASGGQDGILRIWNGTTAALLKTFEPPKPPEPPAAAATQAAK